MRRIFASVLFLVALSVTALAQVGTPLNQDESSGRAQLYDLLKRVPTPRAAAMGNSYVAMKNDPNTLFSNPAALSSQTVRDSSAPGTILSIAASPLGSGITQGSIVFSAPEETLGEHNWVAVGILYNSYGTFQGADNVGQLTNEFSAGDFILSAAYSGIIPDKPFHYGVAVKFISSSLASGVAGVKGSSALAADLGLYYQNDPLLLTVGLSATNIGKQLTYYTDGSQEALPFNLQLGVSKKLERLPLTVHLTFHNLSRDREGRNLFYALNDFSIGGEFILSKLMRFRFGYENQERRDLKVPEGLGLGGFSFGLGFVTKKLQLDYSLSPMGPVKADIHRFGGSYQF
ncbi:MAG: PorV/PorQ family protein [bacterium]